MPEPSPDAPRSCTTLGSTFWATDSTEPAGAGRRSRRTSREDPESTELPPPDEPALAASYPTTPPTPPATSSAASAAETRTSGLRRRGPPPPPEPPVGHCDVGGGPDGGPDEGVWPQGFGPPPHGVPVCSVGWSVRGMVAVPPDSLPVGTAHGLPWFCGGFVSHTRAYGPVARGRAGGVGGFAGLAGERVLVGHGLERSPRVCGSAAACLQSS